MDVHPTPFPGKRRSAVRSTETGGSRNSNKPWKETAPLSLSTTCRSKRPFGVARNTNIPTEKPLSKPTLAKDSKPWKPSGTTAKTSKRYAPQLVALEKKPSNVAARGSDKFKSGKKKEQHVCFQELVLPLESTAGTMESKSVLDNGPCTPLSSTKAILTPGTPYQSAQNCSKCRLDRLEISQYWLSQIKLAEAVGKHFVSAAFFRLALECQAEPFLSLQSELKHYVERHASITMNALWGDLRRAYGLLEDQTSIHFWELDYIDFIPGEQKDPTSDQVDRAKSQIQKEGFLECESIGNSPGHLLPEETMKLLAACGSGLKDDVGAEKVIDGVKKGIPTKEFTPKQKTCSSSEYPNSSEDDASHEKSNEKDSYGGTAFFEDSMANNDLVKSRRSANIASETPSKMTSGSKLSGGELTRSRTEATIKQSNQPQSKGKADQVAKATFTK